MTREPDDAALRTGCVDVRLDRGGRLSIELPGAIEARLFVEGKLQAEWGLFPIGPEDLEEELRQARAARAAVKFFAETLAELGRAPMKADHAVPAKLRAAAFAAGLESGLRGETSRVEYEPVDIAKPPDSIVPPEHDLGGRTHCRGYALGKAIRRALEIAGEELPVADAREEGA